MTLQNFTLGTFSQGEAAAAGAFESIASQTLGSTTTTVTFSSIPSTYQHLQLRMLWRSGSTGFNQQFLLHFNGNTNVNSYTRHILQGDGSSASAFGAASGSFGGIRSSNLASSSDASSLFSPVIIDIHDYALTTKNTTARIFAGYDSNGAGGSCVFLESGLFISTSAISSISITDYNGGGSATNSTFALYGIKGA